MSTSERIEVVKGVCALIYRVVDPKTVLISQELEAKELTGKLASQWGLGYETVKKEGRVWETDRTAIKRCIGSDGEEVKVVEGSMFIPDSLDDSKLCIVRISPPDIGAWVHAYPVPVSDDFAVTRGKLRKEMGEVAWASCEDILEMIEDERKRARISIFRPGTFEILTQHLQRQAEEKIFEVGIFPEPINLPPWEVYSLMERTKGRRKLTQSEALSQLGIDPQPLEDSLALVHSLSARLQKITTSLSPQFSPAFLQ